MDVSFIILTWNSFNHIGKCLDSIATVMGKGKLSYETFVVDNGSTDGTTNLIKKYQVSHPETIKPIFLEKNMGTTYSRNLAIRQAKGDVIVILDSDVELFEGTVEKLVGVLRDDLKVGLAAPKLVYGSGMLQKSTDNFPTIWNKVLRYFFLKAIENREGKTTTVDAIKCVDYAISALWAIRRDVVDKVGLLDENIFYAPEDVDYCLRIWKAGYRILYVPDVTAVHNAQEISREVRINKATVNHILGLFYYFKKHGYIFSRPKFGYLG